MNICASALLMVTPLLSLEPVLNVGPLNALIDEQISLEILGLPPHQKITLHTETICSGELWTAWASFKADDEGNLSLDFAAPVEGSYEGVDPMGLIWSMKSQSSSLFRHSGDRVDVSFFLEIDGEIVDEKQVHRWKMSKEVKKISVREQGLVASLFLPPKEKPLPAVIVLGGSGGGLSDARAQLLASHGLAVLSLAYFGIDPLPRALKKIPLEYCEKAIEWLKNHPSIDADRLGLWGISRGAELALLLGSLFPEKIQAIAAHVPSSVVYSSIEHPEAPAWIFRGAPLAPNAPFPKAIFELGEGATPDQAISLTPLFLEGMKNERAFEAAKIPVEKIECPVLLVSGQNDLMWPSDLFTRQIAERMTAPCVHLSYSGAGHYIPPPYYPTTGTADLHPVAKLWFTFGGNPKDQAFAQVDSWKKTLKFFLLNLQRN